MMGLSTALGNGRPHLRDGSPEEERHRTRSELRTLTLSVGGTLTRQEWLPNSRKGPRVACARLLFLTSRRIAFWLLIRGPPLEVFGLDRFLDHREYLG